LKKYIGAAPFSEVETEQTYDNRYKWPLNLMHDTLRTVKDELFIIQKSTSGGVRNMRPFTMV